MCIRERSRAARLPSTSTLHCLSHVWHAGSLHSSTLRQVCQSVTSMGWLWALLSSTCLPPSSLPQGSSCCQRRSWRVGPREYFKTPRSPCWCAYTAKVAAYCMQVQAVTRSCGDAQHRQCTVSLVQRALQLTCTRHCRNQRSFLASLDSASPRYVATDLMLHACSGHHINDSCGPVVAQSSIATQGKMNMNSTQTCAVQFLYIQWDKYCTARIPSVLISA